MSDGVRSQADFVGGLALALLVASVLFTALVLLTAIGAPAGS
jgi:hypothetical protein